MRGRRYEFFVEGYLSISNKVYPDCVGLISVFPCLADRNTSTSTVALVTHLGGEGVDVRGDLVSRLTMPGCEKNSVLEDDESCDSTVQEEPSPIDLTDSGEVIEVLDSRDATVPACFGAHS